MSPPPPPVFILCDIWMFCVTHASSPWVDTTASPWPSDTSRMGIVVPLISACMTCLPRGRRPAPRRRRLPVKILGQEDRGQVHQEVYGSFGSAGIRPRRRHSSGPLAGTGLPPAREQLFRRIGHELGGAGLDGRIEVIG